MKGTGLILIVMLSLAIGCQKQDTLVYYGTEIFSTEAEAEEISWVCRDAIKAVAERIEEGERIRYPSLGEGVRTWHAEGADDDEQVYRAYIKCRDEMGVSYQVEQIKMPGRPLILLLTCDDKEATRKLSNLLLDNASKRGITVRIYGVN